MQRLAVQIEVKGAFKQVGEIVGTSSDDARFTYTESYLKDRRVEQYLLVCR